MEEPRVRNSRERRGWGNYVFKAEPHPQRLATPRWKPEEFWAGDPSSGAQFGAPAAARRRTKDCRKAMIQDLSQTLRTVLTQPGLPAPLSSAQIVFDRPSDPFTPAQTTVDLFLYDLRENLELRTNELIVEKSNTQSVTHKPPMRLACSYLVTAWPVGGVDLALQEQQLLSQVLQTLAHYPTIPANFLQGVMVGQTPPLPMVALHP